MNNKNGGPAFPTLKRCLSGLDLKDQGLSMRDYFAAKAMQGFMNNCEPTEYASAIAKDAYKIADAMLAEREKGGDD